jgi:2-iminobutanoate/2-iminopropanoate deaminase
VAAHGAGAAAGDARLRPAAHSYVVKLNNYIIDIGTNIAHYREVRDKYVNTAAPPASTTIGVPQLARAGALFEVEAIAVLPPK